MHLVSKCPFAICWPRGCRRFRQADGVVLAFEKQRHQTRVQTLETISVSLVQLPACTTHLLKAASLPAALDGPTPTLPTSMPLSSPALKALLFFLILHGRGGLQDSDPLVSLSPTPSSASVSHVQITTEPSTLLLGVT